MDNSIAVIEGNTFMVSDVFGDVQEGTPHGLFYADTRFLSEYTLKVNEAPLTTLASANLDAASARFYATNATCEVLAGGCLTLERNRFLNEGLHDNIMLVNYCGRPLEVTLTLGFAADFADIFEVRSGHVRKLGKVDVEKIDERKLKFSYRREGFRRATIVTLSEGVRIDGNLAVYSFTLAPRSVWRADVSVHPSVDGDIEPLAYDSNGILVHDNCLMGCATDTSNGHVNIVRRDSRLISDFVHRAPLLVTNDAALQFAYDRAVRDVAALRLKVDGNCFVPAGGLPWYVAMFGRDAAITAYQTMAIAPELAIGALRALARYQSRKHDHFRDEEPGKIPHEIRFGELATLGQIPHSCYYGTVDATPLFLILLSEVYRSTGSLNLITELLPNAEAALEWIDTFGDRDGDGFIEYLRHSSHGLVNQGWKDSDGSISFRDGALAQGEIALAEVQGYVYDAKVRLAEIFEALGQNERARTLLAQAERLKGKFNEEFWMPEEQYFALALDGNKRKVDSITSNPGHCLWSGIVDDDKAALVAKRLMEPDLFSGWGVRTLSSRMEAYNPISYHNGSVWPHDNSLIAAGLARYGFAVEAMRIIRGIIDASAYFPGHRLPELFAGYPRTDGSFPVNCPGANSPQAWAAGAVILMLQTIISLAPEVDRVGAQSESLLSNVRWPGVPNRKPWAIAVLPSPERLLRLEDTTAATEDIQLQAPVTSVASIDGKGRKRIS